MSGQWKTVAVLTAFTLSFIITWFFTNSIQMSSLVAVIFGVIVFIIADQWRFRGVEEKTGVGAESKEENSNGVNLILPIHKWQIEVVRILKKHKSIKFGDILLQLDQLNMPDSYSSMKRIFYTKRGKKFLEEQIINESSYYRLKNPDMIPDDF